MFTGEWHGTSQRRLSLADVTASQMDDMGIQNKIAQFHCERLQHCRHFPIAMSSLGQTSMLHYKLATLYPLNSPNTLAAICSGY